MIIENLSYNSLPINRSITTNKSNSALMSVPLIVLCFFTVFNSNETSASIRFIIIPVVLCFSVTLFLLFSHGINRNKLSGYFSFFMFGLLSLVSTIASDVVQWTPTTTAFFIFYILYFLMSSLSYSSKSIRMFVNVYIILSFMISIIIIFSWIFNYNVENGRASLSFFGIRKDENYVSAYLAGAFCLSLFKSIEKSKKAKSLIMCAIIFFAVFLTGSRAGLVAILLLLFFALAKIILTRGSVFKKIIYLSGTFILLLFFYFSLNNSIVFLRMTNSSGYLDNIRLIIWGHAIEAFTRKPLIGSGIQSGTYFSQLYLRWYTHNCFIDLLTSVGIIGTAFYLIHIISMMRIKRHNILFFLMLYFSFFLPLFFINGYETATFWFPMIVCKVFSNSLKENEIKDIV